MPMPAKYYEYHAMEQMLRELFPEAVVQKRYHGMYDTKCFPNPEAMYVITF